MKSSVRRTLAAGLATLACGALPAHTLWIGLAHDYGEQQVVTSIAYGDYLPGSELLATEWGPMRLATQQLVGPDGSRSDIGVPTIASLKSRPLGSGVTLVTGADDSRRKISYADGPRGTWQIAAQSPMFRYVYYAAKDGSEHYSDQPESSIANLQRVLEVSHEVFFLKGVFAAGGWTDVTPLAHTLEIVPLTDLHSLRAGGVARFRVLLNGTTWQPERGPPLVTASNEAFGDRWGLSSALKNGVAEFRLPTSGLWRFDVRHDTDATKFPALVKNARAGESLTINANLTVHVRP